MIEQAALTDEQDCADKQVRVELGAIISIVDGEPQITPIGCDADDAVAIIRAVAKGLDNVDGMTRQ